MTSVCHNSDNVLCVFASQVKADDADGGSFGAITYSIGSGPASAPPSQFTINKETGQICTSVALDRDEGSDSFDFTVTATDGVRELVFYLYSVFNTSSAQLIFMA